VPYIQKPPYKFIINFHNQPAVHSIQLHYRVFIREVYHAYSIKKPRIVTATGLATPSTGKVLHLRLEVAGFGETNHLLCKPPVFKKYQGRHATDLKMGTTPRILAGVDLGHNNSSMKFPYQIFKQRRKAGTGPAGWRKEVDQNRQFGCLEKFVQAAISEINRNGMALDIKRFPAFSTARKQVLFHVTYLVFRPTSRTPYYY
jgi:hypothetical protein